jgi:hypothetical protein
MRTLFLGLNVTARLAAAFLCGVLLGLAYWLGRVDAAAALLALAGVALWCFALAATRGLHVAWLLQALVMVAGALTAWFAVLLVALSRLAMD